ncbi:gliding motility-associated C-terminal domain-containing protein [Flavobacterium sp.]|uniref:T9SS type B sorting domain-containing protein n=1 Tax=Flavobacterium sp. TaxID=239 RepID=UPI00286D9153|nr:gliding motility-associated C-terminal domain-containing protein [Flavobacterium sp.]
MRQKLYLIFLFVLLSLQNSWSQNVVLYNQFSGRYDFTFVGNTLNPDENSLMTTPEVLTTSDAVLTLSPSDEIESAYLYWAGSGTGDFDVKLNNVNQIPDRTFSIQRVVGTLVLDYFSAFKDVTTLVKSTGNGTYTLSELDISPFIDDHFVRRTNFAGWTIVVVYKNPSLPLNQLTVYDGLQAVPDVLDITLNSLNVIDNVDAKIGFVAWEGDLNIANNESLRINGTVLSNALNPANNAFNGTNSITNASNLFNMDLDIYNIQNNINVGDTSATIQLTSSQDFVMINTIVTKLNSQLPDATIVAQNITQECNTRKLIIDYEVRNFNCTEILPSGTFISVYANDVFVGTAQTTENISIDEFRTYQITVIIPDAIPADFELTFRVDDNNGVASVNETIETNNFFIQDISLWLSPDFYTVDDLINCREDANNSFFDFSQFWRIIKKNDTDVIAYFETESDAITNTNAINNLSNFEAIQVPKTIFVRINDANCFSITSFNLDKKYCRLEFSNYFNPNLNDFFIKGLSDVFPNYELEIYNRWGILVWKGNKNNPKWNGNDNQNGILISGKLPDGTYFYTIDYKDPNAMEKKTSWVFLDN